MMQWNSNTDSTVNAWLAVYQGSSILVIINSISVVSFFPLLPLSYLKEKKVYVAENYNYVALWSNMLQSSD